MGTALRLLEEQSAGLLTLELADQIRTASY